MLIGPNAVLSLEHRLHGVYMTNTYDFYKPNFKVEYPIVNGHESIECYLGALDGCHKNLLERLEQARSKQSGHGDDDSQGKSSNALDLFDYMAFHTPNCKLVSKSYGRLKYNDCLRSADDASWEGIPENLRALGRRESIKSKELEKALVAVTKKQFEQRVEPCIRAPSMCGNMYTASLYCSLISLISNIDLAGAQGKVIGLFSYGSGAASALFGLRITGDLAHMVRKIDLMARLNQRHIADPEEYEQACAMRAEAYGSCGYKPVGSIDALASGTYYIESVNDAYRRNYVRKQ